MRTDTRLWQYHNGEFPSTELSRNLIGDDSTMTAVLNAAPTEVGEEVLSRL